MNLAVGIACPVCGHESANVLEFVKDEFGLLIAHRLRCLRCETVYLDTRESAGPEEDLNLELVLDESKAHLATATGCVEEALSLEQSLQIDVAAGVTQLGQAPRLDLADPLPSRVDDLAHVGEGPGLVTVEPESQPQHLLLFEIQNLKRLDQPLSTPGGSGSILGIGGPGVLDEVLEGSVSVFAHRSV